MSHAATENAPERLRAILDCLERLETEIETLQEEVKDILVVAKSVGFDPRIVRKTMALRRSDPDCRTCHTPMIAELYIRALAL